MQTLTLTLAHTKADVQALQALKEAKDAEADLEKLKNEPQDKDGAIKGYDAEANAKETIEAAKKRAKEICKTRDAERAKVTEGLKDSAKATKKDIKAATSERGVKTAERDVVGKELGLAKAEKEAAEAKTASMDADRQIDELKDAGTKLEEENERLKELQNKENPSALEKAEMYKIEKQQQWRAEAYKEEEANIQKEKDTNKEEQTKLDAENKKVEDANNEITKLDKEMKEYEKAIEEHKKNAESGTEAEKQEALKKIKDSESEKEKAQKKTATLEANAAKAEAQAAKLQNRIDYMKEDIEAREEKQKIAKLDCDTKSVPRDDGDDEAFKKERQEALEATRKENDDKAEENKKKVKQAAKDVEQAKQTREANGKDYDENTSWGQRRKQVLTSLLSLELGACSFSLPSGTGLTRILAARISEMHATPSEIKSKNKTMKAPTKAKVGPSTTNTHGSSPLRETSRAIWLSALTSRHQATARSLVIRLTMNGYCVAMSFTPLTICAAGGRADYVWQSWTQILGGGLRHSGDWGVCRQREIWA